MTQREMFMAIATFLEAASPNMDATPEGMNPDAFLEDAIQFCLDRIAVLDKRKASPKGPTKTQVQNAFLKEDIAEILGDASEPMRAGEIAKAIDQSVQRTSALLKQMVERGSVIRTEDKKVATFSLPR